MRYSVFPIALCLFFASACGGNDEALRDARAKLAAGDLAAAESMLGGDPSFEADDIRRAVARVREERRVLDLKIKDLVKQAQTESSRAHSALERLRDVQTDPVARRTVEQTLTDFDTIVAGNLAAARARAERAKPVREVDLNDVSGVAPNALQKARVSIELKAWANAYTDVAALEKELSHPAEAAALRAQLEDGALTEAQSIIARANEYENERGLAPALEFIERESARFPHSDDFSALHGLRDDMLQRRREHAELRGEVSPASAVAPVATAAKPRAQPPKSVSSDASAEELVASARASAEQGDLDYALKCWTAAGRLLEPGDLRDDYVGEAQDLRARLALRAEILDAFKSAPSLLSDLGITAVDAHGWTDAGHELAWSAIAPDQLKRVASKLDVSKLARRGVVCEALRATNPGERERSITDLARMVERGEIDSADAANLVSRARGGLGTSERYLLDKGQWVTSNQLAGEARRVQLAQLEKAFLRANAEQRDAALHDVIAAGDDAFMSRMLSARSRAALHDIERVRVLDQLADVAKLRRELDDARKSALALIFDEKVYFYPYNPPAPPNTEGDYARAQRRVDELVNVVRAVWKNDRAVRISKEFREAIDDLVWCGAQCATLNVPFDIAGRVPDYALCLPNDVDSINLHEFAWDKADAQTIAYSRRVEARNESMWKEIDTKKLVVEPAAVPDAAEREQVRITNAYRVMMGRRALAWNAKLQLASQGHSDYMANTGDFGHFEDSTTRRTPFDRMKLAGYVHGEGENCAMNDGDAQGAHDGWLHSSGHHRNILEAMHREMASSISSLYWTQNFGADTSWDKGPAK